MEDSVTLNLNPDEQEAVAALQQEMHLDTPEAVSYTHLTLPTNREV